MKMTNVDKAILELNNTLIKLMESSETKYINTDVLSASVIIILDTNIKESKHYHKFISHVITKLDLWNYDRLERLCFLAETFDAFMPEHYQAIDEHFTFQDALRLYLKNTATIDSCYANSFKKVLAHYASV